MAGSLLIRGGTVVGATSRRRADVRVDDGVITAIGDLAGDMADLVIDATDRYVLPGGVDPHTHLDTTYRGDKRTADDFDTGTRAAVAGGTTCLVDFCFPAEGDTLMGALVRWRASVESQHPWVDVGCHMVLVQPDEDVLRELPALIADGVTSVKLFMAYRGRVMSDDASLLRTLQHAGRLGILVLVHAENGDAIDVLVGQALDAGNTSPAWHARTRPPLTEAEAVNRAICLAQLAGGGLYIVHISSEEAARLVATARHNGWNVWGETCPHYLVLDETRLDGEFAESAKFVFSPPARPRHHQDQLWTSLADGSISVLASDHCPFCFAGPKIIGDDFTQILNGIPGVEQRLVLLHHFGVRTGRLTLERMVELTAEQPAKLFGLHPRKGSVVEGADADLVVFDPQRTLRISVEQHHSAVDYLPYEGIEVTGAPEHVVVGGQVMVRSGEIVGTPAGRVLRRDLPLIGPRS